MDGVDGLPEEIRDVVAKVLAESEKPRDLSAGEGSFSKNEVAELRAARDVLAKGLAMLGSVTTHAMKDLWVDDVYFAVKPQIERLNRELDPYWRV